MTKPLKPRDVADLLGISERTVRDMIARGEIPAKKLGKFWLIHPDAIDRLLPKAVDANVVHIGRRA